MYEDDLDARLVRRMAVGDQEALGLLYDRHAPLLTAVARRFLGDGADDLVHDVLLEVWQDAGAFDASRGSVRAWLVTRLRSRALDRLRRSARARVLVEDERMPKPAPARDFEAAPDHRRVRACLETLPEPQRQVLELAYFEDLSASHIAERLGVPVGTVKSRTAAGLARLRVALAERREPPQKEDGR